MLFRMVRPMRRQGSRSRYFVKRIPADLLGRVAGLKLDLPLGVDSVPVVLSSASQSVRVSLRCDVPEEVRRRSSAIDAYLETVWQALRQRAPIPISHMQATALAGEVYRAWATPEGRETTIAIEFTHERRWVPAQVMAEEDAQLWEAVGGMIGPQPDEGPLDTPPILEQRFGPIVDRLLLAKGIAKTDTSSRATILRAVRQALEHAFRQRQKYAEGDYSEDRNLQRFPAWQAPNGDFDSVKVMPAVAQSSPTLSNLVESWWAEARAAGRTQSTYESYRNTTRRLAVFLKHDCAAKITADDILAFKDARLANGISPRTVKDSDLAALRSVFSRAVRNRHLATNPAADVHVLRSKPARLRSQSLTLLEVAALLRHAKAYRPSVREDPKGAAAKRWVPWLCAYTGARLGELVQLRKKDVRFDGKLWVLTITPEAGTVKDKQAREVVLHRDLLAEGFTAFLAGAPVGYLFLKVREGEDIRGVWRGVKTRLAVFVREVVTDKRVAPNHGLRHLFKTIGREAGIEDRVLDAIQGHAPSSVGGRYGEVTLAAKAKAMDRFPTFSLSLDDAASNDDR